MNIAEAREKIRTSQLLNRLHDHVLGEVKMEPTQVRAAEILLKKALPDLTSSDVNVTGKIDIAARLAKAWAVSEPKPGG